MQKLPTFFSKNINVYAISNDQSLNDTLTNDIVSFEQLGPAGYILYWAIFINAKTLEHETQVTLTYIY